jgi:hypothetical protein
MKPGTIEQIEQYLNDEMPAQERKDFELQLATDDELRKDLELYNSINNTMSASPNENKLRQTLQQMNEKYFVAGGVVKKASFKKWLAVAASLIFIIAISFYFLLRSKPSAEKLYAQYAQHEALNIQLRGNAVDSLKEKAATAFNNKNYSTALPLLETCMQQEPADVQIQFSTAICYLETAKYAAAEMLFLQIETGKSAYADAAKWYLALAALKQNDLVKCRSRLNNIPASSAYFVKAKELLEKLPG